MKKYYEEPDVEIIACNLGDIICTSDETPITPFQLDNVEL